MFAITLNIHGPFSSVLGLLPYWFIFTAQTVDNGPKLRQLRLLADYCEQQRYVSVAVAPAFQSVRCRAAEEEADVTL